MTNIQKFRIVAYDKSENNLIDVLDKKTKELKQEPYNFDMIEIDFKGKYVDFTDSRYRTDKKFKNKTILAPIRVSFDELDIMIINKI